MKLHFKAVISAFSLFALPLSSVFAEEALGECANYRVLQPHVHLVTINLQCRNVQLVGTQEGQGSMTTTTFAERAGLAVAINGNFYNPKDYRPMGLIVTNGKPWKTAKDFTDHAYFACDKEKRCDIEAKDMMSAPEPQWHIAVSGREVFENGRFSCAKSAPAGCQAISGKSHPRTAIGLDAEGKFAYLVVVEGRLKDYPGMTPEQLSDVFRRLHIDRGLNLDGGGSSALVINGKRVNRLPDNQPEERAVVNHLGLRLQ